MTAPLRIGTRGSALALAQSRWVAERLPVDAELVTIATTGDRGAAPGDKARWVDAIEAALAAGEVDLAVHSAKDVPGQLTEGTAIVATPPRADPRDVLIGRTGRIGTSSLRRRAQLAAWREDVEVVELRGNVDTRLRKLAERGVDGIVLAAAGLQRLGRDEAAEPLTDPLFVPAPGQGVLALQARVDDEPTLQAAFAVNDAPTLACLAAERAAVRVLGATCHTPVGVHADGHRIRGFVGLPDGSAWLLDEVGELDGEALALRMLAAGARDLLDRAEAAA